jgi:regulator of sirC expression with transglutaminase-like and TPR domain
MFLSGSGRTRRTKMQPALAVTLQEPAADRSRSVAQAVESVLAQPRERLDYAEAKLELDRLADPSGDLSGARLELDRLTAIARAMVTIDDSGAVRMSAIRTLIYEPGPWNSGRPFAYDHSDPLGQSLRSRLLPVYLSTHLGNCISMPILFLILAERLELDVALATAPLHLFVRYHVPFGPVINIETTSGANPARESWIRQHFPMSDRAVANGVYLRSLPRGEAVAHMASTVVEHLLHAGRYDEAIDVCSVILRHAPSDVYVMAKQATAYGGILEREFRAAYPFPYLIPASLRRRYLMLCERNASLWAKAEALGWEAME